ncbi:hypothetical protein MHZ95_19855 [Sporosarcina sp. ACRSM]|uniref:hypothetical protein n=1 Tax=Sporosarcina sp. ACRSM TaxID=2918216 RepID=UPI001EF68677|nr:hypothetical protein [Sporosarcina sp. ACRSM]MCG7337518.1 hypothetical protein [Sporosarcina sp. ACRSM]
MKDNFFKTSSLILCILLLSACVNVEKVQHIEAFVTEVLEENDEGFFVRTGYQKVNAITSIEESKNHIKTDVKSINDFYDTEWNYIRTEIIHSNFKKSHITQAGGGEKRKEEINEPSTILIPDGDVEYHNSINMTEEERERVKEHVLSFMDV